MCFFYMYKYSENQTKLLEWWILSQRVCRRSKVQVLIMLNVINWYLLSLIMLKIEHNNWREKLCIDLMVFLILNYRNSNRRCINQPVILIKTFYQEKYNVILDDISFKSCLCTCFNISTDIEEKFEDTKRDKKGIRMYIKVKVVILKSNWLQPSSRHSCHMYFSSFCYSPIIIFFLIECFN
jgi:hypothetical protein